MSRVPTALIDAGSIQAAIQVQLLTQLSTPRYSILWLFTCSRLNCLIYCDICSNVRSSSKELISIFGTSMNTHGNMQPAQVVFQPSKFAPI